jgi:hypothetical protein
MRNLYETQMVCPWYLIIRQLAGWSWNWSAGLIYWVAEGSLAGNSWLGVQLIFW